MPQYNPLEGLDLPQSQYLPQEYNQQAFGQMQIGQERAEQEQMRKYLEGINAMGRLYTGSALKGGIEQVLGPQMERQQQLLGDIGMRGMDMARGERMTEQGQQFQSGMADRQNEWQAQQNEMQRKAQEQQFLMSQAQQRRFQREGKRFSSQLGQMLPAIAGNTISGGLGTLMAGGAMKLFGGGGGGLPSMNMGGWLPQVPTYMMQNQQNTQPWGGYRYGQ